MSSANVKVTGDKELIARLLELEPKVRNRVLRPAVTAAARPIRAAAKASVPVRFGALKKSIDLKVKTYRKGVSAIIGPRSDVSYTHTDMFGRQTTVKPSKYAHLVEGGAKPHVIRMGKNNKVVWLHSGTKATRFMENSIESQGAIAMSIMNKKIEEGIIKYA